MEEKEELKLRCGQLKGDTKMYRQQSKQTVRQLEEVARERDKVRRRRRRSGMKGSREGMRRMSLTGNRRWCSRLC